MPALPPRRPAITPADAVTISRDREALLKIYEEAFPAIERDPFDEIFSPDGRTHVRVAHLEGRLVGFAELFELPNANLFLRYLAVAEQYRSGGVGRALLDSIADEFAGATARIVFEVEDPPTAPDPRLAVRRIRFYERWGAHELRCIDGYFYPNRQQFSLRERALLFERHLSADSCLSGEWLRDVLRSIYSSYYGEEAARLHLPTLLAQVIC